MTDTMNRFFRLLVALFLFLPALAHGEGAGILVTEEIQLKVADAFMAEGEYYRAVTEYKKFIILFPGSKKEDYAEFRIGLAYFRGDEYEPAARSFASVGARYAGSRYAPEAAYYEGVSYVLLNQPDRAEAAFDKALAADPASEYARTSLLGKSLIEFDRKDIPGCRRQLERFLADYPQDDKAGKVRDAVTLLDLNREPAQKSPVTAGILSALIPGSGHIYAGRYGDGITAFFLNGLFIAGTVVAANDDNYAVAGIVGVIGLPFYIGNIYGAANAAAKYNVGIRKDLRGRLAVTLDYQF